VPAGAEEWDEHRIRIVLRHEIAHIRRQDWSVQLVAEILRCVYWFNPLVWVACRRLRDESEHACDDVVLARGVEASAYAVQLLELARVFASERRSWAAAPAMARSCSLERRIVIMLTPRVNRTPLTRSVRAAIGLAMFGVTAAIAGAAFAQAGPARFSGSVVDPSGAPVPDTTITLTHRPTTTSYAMPTDQTGNFEFRDLRPGEYTIEARTPGFAVLRDSITLDPNEGARRDIRLNIGTVQETITVGAPSQATARKTKDASSVKSFVDKLRGQRLQPPLKITHVSPVYSQALRDAGIEGRVVLEGRIGTDGSVTGIRVVESAHEELVNAARDAASQWRFEPTRLWGTPVETTMTMTFNFVREQ
jgi:TonB family protein